jgi:hypothetical protein
MTQNPQVSATVSKEVHEQIVLLAEKESRSVSSMVSVLLTNAIKERNRKKKSSIEAAN